VQTIVFRASNLAESVGAADNYYGLYFGDHLAGNFSYGAAADEWKSALESLLSVDRVSVIRNGDGESEFWSYGYSYTVSFWGSYGVVGIPALRVMWNVSSDIEVHQNTIHQSGYVPSYSSRYIALNNDQSYQLALRAINSAGISAQSATVEITTDAFGELPGAPSSVVLGQYMSRNSLSLTYSKPQVDGGLPIDAFVIETDRNSVFDPTSSHYRRVEIANVPEVQVITSTYRSGDDVKTRGGTFRVTIGGRSSAPLAYDIAAFDLEVVLNELLGVRHIATAPVTVSRHNWIRGYKWFVTFHGFRGDVGLIQVDLTMLLGDHVQMKVSEQVKGFGDIIPGEYTYEVQTIRTTALSAISSGSFVLDMAGYKTPSIDFNETAESFRQKLEFIPTIYTVKVTRETQSSKYGLYAWTVTLQT